jgi:hypothetical protein
MLKLVHQRAYGVLTGIPNAQLGKDVLSIKEIPIKELVHMMKPKVA